ncbi:MAG: aspartyl protease family protein [Phycisphaerae bacterium]|nr:aspartyl protease family protein [Phycisphaerae bacterium]
MFRRLSILTCVIASCVTAGLHAGSVPAIPPSTGFRLANGMKIISVTPSAKALQSAPDIRIAAETPSLPQPPMAGFSPLVAIVTSDRRSSDDFDWEHALVSSYVGKPLNPPAEENFVVGILDTGSVVDLVAGDSATVLGLKGSNLTTSEFPIGGVSGTMDTIITKPIGVFAAGLAAIKADGQLDLSKLVGHTNVAALASPAIGCSNGEDVSALVGTPLLAFYTTIINVDQPRKVVVRGKTYIGPDVQITSSYTPPTSVYRHKIPMELGGLSPVATASYYAFPDLSDWENILGEWLPLTPTLLSMAGGDLPLGGSFFADVGVLQGQAGPLNALQTARMLVDTGAQSSIISSNIAAKLNLPLEPDFTALICGVGGTSEVPGYYVDYVRINAMGGALEFAHVPFVVLDMDSPEGGSLDGILGTNLFWNRNVVLEPTTSGTGFLHISDPVPFAFIDLNLDGVIDGQDFAVFAAAWRTTVADPAWNPMCDLFVDDVIDARDLEAFVDAWVYMLSK